MSLIGDGENSLLVIKTITYVFSYVYLQNAFKNLIIAYPRNKGFRIIYHVIRFEFKRATPTHVQGIIDRIENVLTKEHLFPLSRPVPHQYLIYAIQILHAQQFHGYRSIPLTCHLENTYPEYYYRDRYQSIFSYLSSLSSSFSILSIIPLSERCRRVNEYKTSEAILISIHCNAAGNGSNWMQARGWEAWTSVGQTKADKLADCLYATAEECLFGMKIRKDMADGDPDKESSFYILKHTKCPAVLTENLFQDNKEDVDFLLSEEGKRTIVSLHVKGICKYLGI